MRSRSKRLFGFGRAHSSVPAPGGLVAEHSRVVVDRPEESGVGPEREHTGDADGDGLDRTASKAGEEQVGADHCHAHENGSVEVAPDGDEEDDPPDPPRREAMVSAKKKEEEREEREGEQLHLHCGERGQRAEDHQGQGDGGGAVTRAGPARSDGQEHQRGRIEEQLGGDDADWPWCGEAGQDQLAEHRHVRPPAAVGRSERDTVGDRAPLEDVPTESDGPVGVRPDRDEERTEEECGDHCDGGPPTEHSGRSRLDSCFPGHRPDANEAPRPEVRSGAGQASRGARDR